MAFIEQKRSKLEDGREIVYSAAYVAMERFERAEHRLQNAEEELAEAQKRVQEAKDELQAAGSAFVDALAEHYDGYDNVPKMINTGSRVIRIDEDMDGIPMVCSADSRSYCDLYYTTEKKPEAA